MQDPQELEREVSDNGTDSMQEQCFHFLCRENNTFPNNKDLEVCILKHIFSPALTGLAEVFERHFKENGWPPAWRNGLYATHHFHSTAHEALGVYSGWVEACFGGPGGPVYRAEAGDVIVIPAGVSHKNMGQSNNFSVVGAYPQGQRWNMRYGKAEERPQVDDDISQVALPSADPVFGINGPLMRLWCK